MRPSGSSGPASETAGSSIRTQRSAWKASTRATNAASSAEMSSEAGRRVLLIAVTVPVAPDAIGIGEGPATSWNWSPWGLGLLGHVGGGAGEVLVTVGAVVGSLRCNRAPMLRGNVT